MPRSRRVIIELKPGDRVEITSQGELEIMILGNQPQRRRRSRRGRRNQRKRKQTCSCQKHEKPRTPEPQPAQNNKCSENPNHKQEQPEPQRPAQPQQPRFETQQRLSRRYTQSVDGLKQRDIDEATRQRSEYRERLQRILDVAQVQSSHSDPKKSKYVPAQYQREGASRPQDESQKPQAQAEQPSRGQYQPQSKPQSQPGDDWSQSQPQIRQEQQHPYTEPMEKQVDEATRRLSQQGLQSQQLMDVPQSRSASGQPLQQLSHDHPEPQLYMTAQYQIPDARPQKPPQLSQVQSREPFLFQQNVNAPSSPQTLSDRTLQALFPWTVGAHVDVDSPRQKHPQSQPRKMQEKEQQPSSHDTEPQNSVPCVLDSCHIPWAFAQLGPGNPPSEPDTDYEQLNFDGSRSPSIVSLSSDSDEGIVIIGNWKATEGDGSWW